MFRLLFRHSILYAGALALSSLLSLLCLPIYTRRLSAEDLGTWDLLQAAMTFVNLTVALEITQGIARFLPDPELREKRGEFAASAFWFSTAIYSGLLVASLCGQRWVEPWILGRPIARVDYLLSLLFIAGSALAYFSGNLLRSLMQPSGFAIFHAFRAVLMHGVACIGLTGFGWSLRGVLVACVLLQVLPSLVVVAAQRGFLLHRPRMAALREMLAFSLPLVPSSVAVFVSLWVDRIAIGQLMSIADVGRYGVALRFASVVLLASGGIQQALLPLVFNHHQEPSTRLLLSRLFTAAVGIGLLLIVCLDQFAADLILRLTAPDYRDVSPVIVLLSAACGFSALGGLCPGMSIARRTGISAAIQGVTAVLNTVLNFALIPYFGLVGAASATLISSGVNCACSIAGSQRFYAISIPWRRLAMTVAAVLGLLAASRGLTDLPGATRPIGIVVASLVVVTSGLLWPVLRRVPPPSLVSANTNDDDAGRQSRAA